MKRSTLAKQALEQGHVVRAHARDTTKVDNRGQAAFSQEARWLWKAHIYVSHLVTGTLHGWYHLTNRGSRDNAGQSEGKKHYRCLTTVFGSGSNHATQMYNLLSNAGNQSRGAVLAEPFPWTVIQGVILVFVIVNSQL